MEMIQRITPKEMEMMKAYIETYGDVDGEGCTVTAEMSYILRFWNEQKAALGRLFEDKLILTRNVNITKPHEILTKEVRDNCLEWGSEGRAFYSDFCDWAREKYSRGEIDYATKDNLFSLVSATYLATNVYKSNSFSMVAPDGSRVDIPNGCKCSKILGKLNKVFNISENFEKFRIAHSMCLNQKMMKGELCLSIHPLDYMTMSDNMCNWDSCMSWMNTGDYRQGTVEMMNSPYIVVAYLTSSNPMKFHISGTDFEWNSKKWRQLFIASPDILMGIKHYPFHSDDLTKICLNWMRELAEKNGGWGPYTQEPCKVSEGREANIPELGSKLYCQFEMGHMYNDINRDHSAYISTAIADPIMGKSRLIMYLSGVGECMTCGAQVDYDCIEPDELQCHRCNHTPRCECCGSRVYNGDSYWLGDTLYCGDCYYDIAVTCACCEDAVHKDDTWKIYLRHGDQVTGYYFEVCDWCHDRKDASWREHCGDSFEVKQGLWYQRTYECVDSKNLDDEGWDMFNIWGSEKARMMQEIAELEEES